MLIPFPELIKKYNINPVGVLHCGASWGQEAESYYANGILRSIWIECIPEVFYKLCDHIAKYPNVIAFNACIDETPWKEVKFNISNNDGESSSIHEFGVHKKLHPSVDFIRTETYMTKRIDGLVKDLTGFDFLNIDLQCSELSALKSMGKLLDGFKYAYLELNQQETYTGCPLFPEVKKFMEDKGFELVEAKWVNDKFNKPVWGDGFFIRK